MKELFQPDVQVGTRSALAPVVPVTSAPVEQALAPSSALAPSAASVSAVLPPLGDSALEQRSQQTMQRLSQVPAQLLEGIKLSAAGDFGSDLTQLVGLAKGLDPQKLRQGGLVDKALSLFSSTKERLMARYTTVEKQMDALTAALDTKAAVHVQRIAECDKLYALNATYYQELDAVQKQWQQHLQALQGWLQAQAQPTSTQEAEQMSEARRAAERIEKRIDDLERAKLMSQQVGPQIRLQQDNSRGLVEKFADIKAVTLPAWKNVFYLHVLQIEQAEDVKFAKSIDDMTNTALQRGADLLRQNTVEVAQSRQRAVVDIATLQHVQTQLLGAFDDVQRINDEGRAQRQAAQPQLAAMERDLMLRMALPSTSPTPKLPA